MKYELETKINRVARHTGKKYSQWSFVGWGKFDDYNEDYIEKKYIKGEWLHIVLKSGTHDRYKVGKDFQIK